MSIKSLMCVCVCVCGHVHGDVCDACSWFGDDCICIAVDMQSGLRVFQVVLAFGNFSRRSLEKVSFPGTLKSRGFP